MEVDASQRFDVLVVGAGLAGLQAARRLVGRGLRVAVLEARDKVGGRTKTVELNGHPFDVGGQWIGPGQPRMVSLIEEFGLETNLTYTSGKRVLDLRGQVSTYRGTIPRINPWTLVVAQWSLWQVERLCKLVPKDNPWKCAKALEWDSMTALEWVRQNVRSPAVVDMLNGAVRVVFGSDLGELSLLYFLFYLHSAGGFSKLIECQDGNQERWIVGGAQQLCLRMAETSGTVCTSTPVREIRQEPNRVVVSSERGVWSAKRVIVAVPIPMSDRIQYVPALPTVRDQMTQRVGMGATVKVHALYEDTFWRDQGYSGESVCTEGPVTVTFDQTTSEGQACLLTFVTGAPARGWSERSEDDRRQIVLGTLARYFGEKALNPTHYLETDWASEPFVGGAPVATFSPGTLTSYGSALRAPVGRIHWAGTETARESTGFMEGALESGERVADEVWRALQAR